MGVDLVALGSFISQIPPGAVGILVVVCVLVGIVCYASYHIASRFLTTLQSITAQMQNYPTQLSRIGHECHETQKQIQDAYMISQAALMAQNNALWDSFAKEQEKNRQTIQDLRNTIHQLIYKTIEQKGKL